MSKRKNCCHVVEDDIFGEFKCTSKSFSAKEFSDSAILWWKLNEVETDE